MVIKKLIAISVVFALVAGTAFAVDLAGQVFGVTNVIQKAGDVTGTDTAQEKEARLFTGGINRVRLEGSGEADIGVGSVGGWARLEAGSSGGGISGAGLAWWQPIEALRIQIGLNPDGHYDTSHIARHGFYQQANEMGLVNSGGNWGPTGSTSWDSAVFGGFSDPHFAFIITPMEALSINIAIPLNVDPNYAADVVGVKPDSYMAATFKAAMFQVNYTAGFGSIHLTYKGAGSTETDYDLADDPTDKYNQLGPATTLGKFYASTHLTMIENLGIEFGLGFEIGKAGYKPPLGIGLAASYNVGSFGIKFRSIFEMAMDSAVKGADKIFVRVDVLPSFAVNDSVSIFLDAGIWLAGKENFMWHVAPYVRIGNGYGPAFYAGLKANNIGQYDKTKLASGVNIAIPVGITAVF